MRLVTWNCCRGPYARKMPLLDALAPDIAVVQECAKPEFQSPNCLWFGDNPNKVSRFERCRRIGSKPCRFYRMRQST